jgi:sec-independent protein translocase protein TatA
MLLFLNLGGGEVVVILLVILLFFGSKSIPSLAQGLGRGIREFKEAADGIKREIEETAKPIKDQMHIDLDEAPRDLPKSNVDASNAEAENTGEKK